MLFHDFTKPLFSSACTVLYSKSRRWQAEQFSRTNNTPFLKTHTNWPLLRFFFPVVLSLKRCFADWRWWRRPPFGRRRSGGGGKTTPRRETEPSHLLQSVREREREEERGKMPCRATFERVLRQADGGFSNRLLMMLQTVLLKTSW